MLRLDPPSFVLIDYGGSKETIWAARMGYGVRGRGEMLPPVGPT